MIGIENLKKKKITQAKKKKKKKAVKKAGRHQYCELNEKLYDADFEFQSMSYKFNKYQ